MKLVNHQFENMERLERFVEENIPSCPGVLIQLYCGVTEKEVLQPLLDWLSQRLPDAALIGVTTAGEIMNGTMVEGGIVISFSLFDTTEIKTYYYPKSDFEQGVRAAQEGVGDRTKACIVFCEGLRNDSESFLEGFTSVRSDVMIAGGNAGDNYRFVQTFVAEGDRLYDEGVVVAVLDSDALQVHNAYSLNWTSVGKEMTITKADKNIVYEIDGKPVRALYTHYLGAETVERIPASAIEFPLVKIEEGVRIARSIIAQTEEGGFVYAGHFKNGDKVHFAIGNIEEILDHAVDVRNAAASAPAEAIYIYSCSVRKRFLQEQLNYEFGLIDEIAPSVGFFTYGEFFHSSSDNQLLNITTTTLSLSENAGILPSIEDRDVHPYRHTMLKSLTHLINVTQNELNENIKFLDQYKMVLDESAIVSKTDVNGKITYVNDSFCATSGYTRDELIGKRHNILRHQDTAAELHRELWETIKAGKVWKNTFKNRSKSGSEYYLKSVIVPIVNDEGKIVEFIAASVDVSELIMKERIIQRQLTDELTGLKNRTALWNDLKNMYDKTMLVVLNIDRFSDINSYFGYDVGDRLLRAFGDRLAATSETERIYRISGDEFVIVFREQTLDDTVRKAIFDRVSALEHQKFNVEGYEIAVDISCGVACAAATDVYNFAHIALKEAKEQRVKVIFFGDHKALGEKTRNNVMYVDKIKSAIENDRIVPYFQGIVDNKTRQIVKYESLIRLIDSDGTVLTPYRFLEHAKKSKLYEKLTRIMITKTFDVFEALEYEFSLNLTLQDIMSEKTRNLLYNRLQNSSASNRLVFEIVESEGIENFDEVTEFIKTVKKHGCKIAIDDFGTGYSNFSYLSKLDVDYIKIDGSLIKNINHDEDHLFTVESILHFARKKGIETIAEFVEDEAIYTKLVELGITYSQGYFFSLPSPSIHR